MGDRQGRPSAVNLSLFVGVDFKSVVWPIVNKAIVVTSVEMTQRKIQMNNIIC
jgi:hypothetical protein